MYEGYEKIDFDKKKTSFKAFQLIGLYMFMDLFSYFDMSAQFYMMQQGVP